MSDIPQLSINADFPGGNIRVLGQDGATVRLSTDLRDTTTYWFYWRFRAVFPGAGTWRFAFDDRAVGTRGPAVRREGEREWHWLTESTHESDREFEWTAAGAETVEFCQCIPYMPEDFDAFAASLADNRRVFVGDLCHSRKRRPVPMMLLYEGSPSEALLLTCRHHAQESMASYALEGILRALASDEPWAREFRRRVLVAAVPFVDRDGVEDGDQGKNRAPHDPNRDYGAPEGAHVYPECAGVDLLINELHPAVVLDLHSPWLRGGPTNEYPYLVGINDERTHPAMERFAQMLERHCPPEAPYFAADTLPFGAYWNTGANYTQGMPLGRWASQHPFVQFGRTLEIPFANFREKTQTPATIRAFGRGVAEALAEFFADRFKVEGEGTHPAVTGADAKETE